MRAVACLVLGAAGLALCALVVVWLTESRTPARRAQKLKVQAELHRELGQLDDAAAALEQALALVPGDTHAVLALARARAAQGRTDEAVRLLEEARARSSDPLLAVVEAELRLGLGDADGAARVLSPQLGAVLDLRDPLERSRGLLAAGRAATLQGALGPAEALLRAAAHVGTAPVASVARVAADALLALAELLLRSGRLAEAEEALRAARDFCPWDARIPIVRAEVLRELGAADRALRELEPMARGEGPDAVAAARAMGDLLLHEGRPDEALSVAQALADRDDGAATHLRAEVALATGDASAVDSETRHLSRLHPASATPHVLQARAAGAAGRPDAAREAFERALDAEPGALEPALGLLDLELRRGDDDEAALTRALALLPRPEARGHALDALLLAGGDEHLERAATLLGQQLDLAGPRGPDSRARTARGLLRLARAGDGLDQGDLDLLLATPEASAASLLGEDPAGVGRALEALERLAQTWLARPTDAAARIRLAQVLERLDRAALALRLLGDAPGDEAHLLRARACVRLGDLAGALAALEAMPSAAEDPALLGARAELHLLRGDAAPARDLLLQVVARADAALVRARLGRARARAGEPLAAALEEFARARALDARLPFAHEDGLLLLESDPAAAMARFSGGLEAAGDLRFLTPLAGAAALAGRPQDALAALRQGFPHGAPTPEVQALLSLIEGLTRAPAGEGAVTAVRLCALRALGWFDEAHLLAAEVASRQGPDLLAVWWALRAVDPRRDPGAAATLAAHAERLAGDDLTLALDAVEVLGRAGRATEQRAALARLTTTRASGAPDPARELRDADSLTRLGMQLEATGDAAGAEARYRAALARRPDDPVALNNLACLLTARPDARDEALELARHAARRAARSPEVLDTLGWLLHLAGQHEQAAAALRWAALRLPEEPAVRYHAAAALAALGDRRRARQHLTAALQHDGWRDVAAARELLARLDGGGR